MTGLALLVPVEQVEPGDVVRLPNGGEHVVTHVEGPYEDGRRVVVYMAYDERSYNGWGIGRRQGAFERGLAPMAEGESVPLARRHDLDELRYAVEALGGRASVESWDALEETWR